MLAVSYNFFILSKQLGSGYRYHENRSVELLKLFLRIDFHLFLLGIGSVHILQKSNKKVNIGFRRLCLLIN